MYRKIVALSLALILALGGSSALAENTKHEHVFAVLSADGTLQSLTDTVRLENADELEEITDRTLLSGVQNTGGSEAFSLEGETLTWQAGGKDIVYQGTSDKALPVTPAAVLRLDGEEISAADLADRSGRAELTVTYTQPEAVPHLAVTLLLLPEEGVSHPVLENAALVSLAGRQAVVGWGVPGADDSLGLPASFSVSFDADHPRLGWMMTFASADPVDAACREISARLSPDVLSQASGLTALLTAAEAGAELPETTGLPQKLAAKINEMNSGLTSLNDSAKKLADGAAALDTGLAALSGNSEALNTGADALFAALLRTANEQLAASGLAESGLTLPELTAGNYTEVLSAAAAQLEKLSAVSEQAKAGAESLKALLEQLTQADAFVTGIHTYTGGVDQAAAGAKELAAGASALHDDGTDSLRTSILGAEKKAAGTLRSLLQDRMAEAVRIFSETKAQMEKCGYDLRPADMAAVTLYILRTDF